MMLVVVFLLIDSVLISIVGILFIIDERNVVKKLVLNVVVYNFLFVSRFSMLDRYFVNFVLCRL